MNLDYLPDAQSAAFEKDHWWVCSRFGLLDRAMRRMDPTTSLKVLEVGCGTGLNLNYLENSYGNRVSSLLGIDPEAKPESGTKRVIQRDLPSQESFDLILAMDVLEHVDHPEDLLTRLYALLGPAGRLLVTVPAFPWLWTTYDQLAHHRKRYTLGDLTSELHNAHFIIEECFFLFGLLFPLFVIQRLRLKWRPVSDARLFKPVPAWLNHALYTITSWERRTVMSHNRWFGSSVVALARKTAAE